MHSRNDASLSTSVTERLICVPVTTAKHITTEEYTNCWTESSVFGSRAVIKEHVIGSQIGGVEAGSNTSTVTLRVVGGDEKGSLESETVKYGHEFHGTQTRK
jgi:hypothetical protein